jgi:hypothetical protein
MTTNILSAGWVLGADRVPMGRRGTRAVARPDEDALTLAVEAAGHALREQPSRPAALIFASTSAPYDEGGCAQILAEMLGLQDDLFTLELTSTERDGLAALRVGMALAAQEGKPVLVCAAHADATLPGHGAGAIALLLGEDDGLATVTRCGSHTEELRDHWRPRGGHARLEADRSFIEGIGTARLAETAWTGNAGANGEGVLISGPDARAAAKAENDLAGPGDPIAAHVGHLGAAHPLARLVCSLDASAFVMAMAGGMADYVLVEPGDAGAGAKLAAALVEDAKSGGQTLERPRSGNEAPGDFTPFVSIPRAWRERAMDLRLEGLIDPHADGSARIPAREAITGTVLTWVRDHVYPAAKVTDMAVVDIAGGGRFYGQVATGDEVAIGDQVRLVPRRLFEADGMIQYFWKVAACP